MEVYIYILYPDNGIEVLQIVFLGFDNFLEDEFSSLQFDMFSTLGGSTESFSGMFSLQHFHDVVVCIVVGQVESFEGLLYMPLLERQNKDIRERREEREERGERRVRRVVVNE